jgi:hypothetical protein
MVSCKKKKSVPAPLILKVLPYIEQELIIPTDTTFHPDELMKVANYALNHLNLVIANTTEITHPPFSLARMNSHNRLVLMTNPSTPASAYTPFMLMLLNDIKSLKPVTGAANSTWIKFLLYNIPTNTSLTIFRTIIELTYPTLKLIQEPHWLIPTE